MPHCGQTHSTPLPIAGLRACVGATALVVLALALTGCGETRSRTFTVSQQQVSDRQIMLDEQAIEDMSGVEGVRTQHHPDGTAVLSIIVDEDDAVEVLDQARALGYSPVRN